jgi:tRNA pseudouridine55 synthase
MNGVLVLDKPAGVSSARAVHIVKKLLGVECAGHGGTLDPEATGVLPIAVGEATKCLTFLLAADKEYQTDIALGAVTDTGDRAGRVIERSGKCEVDRAQLDEVLACFRGEITQRPPAFSAIKQGGQPLYQRARAGEQVVAEPRQVVVHSLELLGVNWPTVTLKIHCSKGTYIRSLAVDIGERLGTGAYVAKLRRTRSGPFRIQDAIGLGDGPDGLEARVRRGHLFDQGPGRVVSPAEALAELPAVELSDSWCRRVVLGQRPPVELLAAAVGSTHLHPVRLLSPEGALVAVAKLPAESPAAEAPRAVELLRVFANRKIN